MQRVAAAERNLGMRQSIGFEVDPSSIIIIISRRSLEYIENHKTALRQEASKMAAYSTLLHGLGVSTR